MHTYIARYIDWSNNNTSITFHCVFSHSCGALIGGCTITVISQTAGISINQTEAVVGGSKVVEVSFNNLNFSESYNYSASFIRQDLVIPIGGLFNGIIPAMRFDSSSYSSSSSIYPSQSVTHAISAVSMATSLPVTILASTTIRLMESTPTGSLIYLHVCLIVQ